MPNSTNMAISVQETINAQKDKITRIFGNITQEGIKNLEEEISAILVDVKSDHFKEVRINGHLSVIIPVEEYRTIIGDNAWTYNPPVDIDAYNPTSYNAIAAVRAVKGEERKRKLASLETFNGTFEGAKDLIIYGVGEYSVVEINQQYVVYGGVTPKKMMQHIRDKTCIKMTMLDKSNFKKTVTIICGIPPQT